MESNNNKVSSQQLAAKKYIEENDIEKVISEMLNSLVHERAKQPLVYMIKYLAGLLKEEEMKQHGLVIPEPYPKGKPIVKFPDLDKMNQNCLLKKHLTKNVWSLIKHNRTKFGGNIMNIIKLGENSTDDKIGCVLTDASCITTFSALLGPLIAELHKFETEGNKNAASSTPLNEYRQCSGTSSSENFPFYENIQDRVVNYRISYSRNIQDMPFTPIMSSDKRILVENTIKKGIDMMVADKVLKEGKFLNFNENEGEITRILKKIEFDENLLKYAEINLGWPNNRQVFLTDDEEVVILINFIDHLQLAICKQQKKEEIPSNNNEFSKFFNHTQTLIRSFEKYFNFDFDKHYGYLNTCPTLLGAGLQINCEIVLENMTKVSDYMKVIENMKFDDAVFASDNASLLKTKSCYKLSYKSEIEFLEDYYSKISGLINLDKDNEKLEALKLSKYELDDKQDPAITKAYNKVYEEYKYIISSSGSSLNSLVRFYKENPMTLFGILFTESPEYKTFHKFVREYIHLSQNFDIEEHDHIHKPDQQKNFIPIKTSASGKHLSTNVCLIRNLSGFPFVTSKHNKNSEIEDSVIKALEIMKMKNFSSKYIPMNCEEVNKVIQDFNITFFQEELKKFGVLLDFPANRGVILFEKDSIYAVVNDIDHIKLQINITDEDLQNHFINLLKLSNEFSKQMKFVYDKRLGFLTACPRFVGTGLIIKTKLKLNQLNKEKIENILGNTDFVYKIENDAEGLIEVTNKVTIGRSETDLMANLIYAINEILSQDE